MMLKRILLVLSVCVLPGISFAGKPCSPDTAVLTDLFSAEVLHVTGIDQQELLSLLHDSRPHPFRQLLHRQQKNKQKLTAALLAFPLPFGIVGLHRIYLGSAPYVPVVYITSFGGILGLLPMIDFCFILLDKKTETFTNNKHVFMWVN
jgi:TM2 domain-containing membrane protein YozV